MRAGYPQPSLRGPRGLPKTTHSGQGVSVGWPRLQTSSEAEGTLADLPLWTDWWHSENHHHEDTMVILFTISSGLLEGVMFAPQVTQNALPSFHPRCGIKSSFPAVSVF